MRARWQLDRMSSSLKADADAASAGQNNNDPHLRDFALRRKLKSCSFLILFLSVA